MSDHDHAAARTTHLQATLEHHRWKETLREIRTEHETTLLKISALFRTEEIELDALEERIEDHRLLIEEHDAAMTEHEMGGDEALHGPWEELHAELEAFHEKVGRQVERLQDEHHRRISALRQVLREVTSEGS